MQVALELVRSIRSRHPGEIEALYRCGAEYLYVWTVPSGLATGPLLEDPADGRSWAEGDGCFEERSACFHADVDANVTDWKPITVATGPGSRDKVFAQLGGAASHATD